MCIEALPWGRQDIHQTGEEDPQKIQTWGSSTLTSDWTGRTFVSVQAISTQWRFLGLINISQINLSCCLLTIRNRKVTCLLCRLKVNRETDVHCAFVLGLSARMRITATYNVQKAAASPQSYACSTGVCAILLRLYTSTEHLKRAYTSPRPFLGNVISDKLCF
jgi:hypothetical protein